MKAKNEDREVARILRRLSTQDGRLVADRSGYRLTGRGGAAGRVGAETVRLLLSRDLIAAKDGGYRLSDLGRAFLRRHLAGADGFAAQHQNRIAVSIRDEEHDVTSIEVNLDESPLTALRARKGRDGQPLIDAAEFAAGERFRSDYSRARIMPRVTANWTAAVAPGRRDGGAGGMAELTDAVLDARRRVEKAIDAVGPDLAGVLIDFCCFLKGIEEIERANRWPVRSAKLVLRLALASLARHYGIAAEARGPERGSLRHWGAADYRPTID